MQRFMVISADCHWGDSVGQYRQYIEAKHLDDFDRHAAEVSGPSTAHRRLMASSKKAEPAELARLGLDHLDERDEFALYTDNSHRLRALEADGMVGEVIFPNKVIPFLGSFTMAPSDRPLELQLAGMRAYNRALADFVDPNRQVGLAVVSFADVDAAVTEIEWARAAGLRGIVASAAINHGGLPTLGMSGYYERIWDVCAATGMPIHFHGGSGAPPYRAENPGSMLAHGAEALFWSHRPLWFLIAGGVLEAHPNLQLVFAEQYSDWPPRVLGHMDFVWADSVWSLAESLPQRPSEYWRRQCFLGSSSLSRKEVALRYEIGVDKIMFGSDFPHPEGTWGKTTQFLQAAFREQGVTEPEARAMLGESAARLYGLPLDHLNRIAESCGPKLEEILSDADAAIDDPQLMAALERPLSP